MGTRPNSIYAALVLRTGDSEVVGLSPTRTAVQ